MWGPEMCCDGGEKLQEKSADGSCLTTDSGISSGAHSEMIVSGIDNFDPISMDGPGYACWNISVVNRGLINRYLFTVAQCGFDKLILHNKEIKSDKTRMSKDPYTQFGAQYLWVTPEIFFILNQRRSFCPCSDLYCYIVD